MSNDTRKKNPERSWKPSEEIDKICQMQRPFKQCINKSSLDLNTWSLFMIWQEKNDGGKSFE